MVEYKQEFIEFMVRAEVLLFGDFVTKSGRNTPFFINTGKYRTGEQIAKLGNFYAQAIVNEFGKEATVLFGPAYKGIPLVVTTSIALSQQHGYNPAFSFNRKEIKDHGEGGALVGHKITDGDKILIVEDVTTAGTSIRESVALIDAVAKVSYTGIIVSVDRMEKGTGEKSALEEIYDTYGIKISPIVTLEEIVEYLHGREIDGRVVLDDAIKEKIDEYRKKYGV